jgi:hypothetical protein
MYHGLLSFNTEMLLYVVLPYQSIILQYVNTGKYCFILQILILGLFTDVLVISILMFIVQYSKFNADILVFPVFSSIIILWCKQFGKLYSIHATERTISGAAGAAF